jgi:hypothetical protein
MDAVVALQAMAEELLGTTLGAAPGLGQSVLRVAQLALA